MEGRAERARGLRGGAGGGEGELRERSWADSSVVRSRRQAHTDYQKQGSRPLHLLNVQALHLASFKLKETALQRHCPPVYPLLSPSPSKTGRKKKRANPMGLGRVGQAGYRVETRTECLEAMDTHLWEESLFVSGKAEGWEPYRLV